MAYVGTDTPLASKRVAIVGAGPSGIVTAKCLIEEGHTPAIFEKRDRIGGIWAFDPLTVGGAIESTIMQSSKFISCLSDYPMPDDCSVFPTAREIEKYLSSCVDHFELGKYISLNSTVERIEQRNGKWLVSASGQQQYFDAVAICAGMYWDPLLPNFSNMNKFVGTLIHAGAFKDSSIVRGKRVVVVGGGVSGMDIAIAATKKEATKVVWSRRSKNWFKPRWAGGVPFEQGVLNTPRLNRDELIVSWTRTFPEFVKKLQRLDLLPEKEPLLECIASCDDIADLIDQGKINVKPALVGFGKNCCFFEDGAAEEADIVILATGYKGFDLKFFVQEIRDQIRAEEEEIDLYEHMFHPNFAGLAFVFHVTANVPMLPLIELQGRLFAQVLSGKIALPDTEFMKKWIEEKNSRSRLEYNKTRYRGNFVDGEYCRRLAEKLGILPERARKSDYLASFTPPVVPQVFRLYGHGRKSDAVRMIENTRRNYSSQELESYLERIWNELPQN